MKKIIKILIAILNHPAISKTIADIVVKQMDKGHGLTNWIDYHMRYNQRLMDVDKSRRKWMLTSKGYRP